ncbi:MAG: hypothetical protein GC185_03115 [Alphaproteobacteria bacterium]|nr:hypothetical protein [Alphaproteobacteria bacterium]
MSAREIFKRASAADKARARKEAINKPNMHGTNRFFAAIEKGNLPLVRKLVEEGADIHARTTQQGVMSSFMANIPYAVGATPLHAACLAGNPEIVEFLLQQGAQPNAKDSADQSPMDYAIISFGFWQADLERREQSRFTTQNQLQKSAGKLHDFEMVVAQMQAKGGKSSMFEMPDALRLNPVQAHRDSVPKPPPRLP